MLWWPRCAPPACSRQRSANARGPAPFLVSRALSQMLLLPRSSSVGATALLLALNRRFSERQVRRCVPLSRILDPCMLGPHAQGKLEAELVQMIRQAVVGINGVLISSE